jgi:hypothetical protein
MDDEQQGDLTPMAMNATVQHELFLAWQSAGFTEMQAFDLLKIAVFAAFGGHF